MVEYSIVPNDDRSNGPDAAPVFQGESFELPLSRLLEGGKVNKVTCTGNIVVKHYLHHDNRAARESRLNGEVFALERFKEFEQHGVRVPRLLRVDTNELTIEVEKIDGLDQLDSKLRSGQLLTSEAKHIVWLAAGALRNIHTPRVDFKSAEPCVTAFLNDLSPFVEPARDILTLERTRVEDVLRFITDHISPDSIASMGETYLHGDFWLNNIIVDSTGVPVVLDWESAHFGSPYEDLASAKIFIMDSLPNGDSFMDAYGESPINNKVLEAFVLARALVFLGRTPVDLYIQRKKEGYWFHRALVGYIQEALGTTDEVGS